MTVKQNRERGKRAQRELGKLLKMQNVGTLGKDDLRDSSFSVEVKDVAKSYLHKVMEQSERNTPEYYHPLVCIHKRGDEYRDSIICMRVKTWIRLVEQEGKI